MGVDSKKAASSVFILEDRSPRNSPPIKHAGERNHGQQSVRHAASFGAMLTGFRDSLFIEEYNSAADVLTGEGYEA